MGGNTLTYGSLSWFIQSFSEDQIWMNDHGGTHILINLEFYLFILMMLHYNNIFHNKKMSKVSKLIME